MDQDAKRIKKLLVTNIKYYRNRAGLTQEQAAEKAGITVNYWQRLEMASQANFPSFVTLDKVASVLDVKMHQLLESK